MTLRELFIVSALKGTDFGNKDAGSGFTIANRIRMTVDDLITNGNLNGSKILRGD